MDYICASRGKTRKMFLIAKFGAFGKMCSMFRDAGSKSQFAKEVVSSGPNHQSTLHISVLNTGINHYFARNGYELSPNHSRIKQNGIITYQVLTM